MSLESVLCLECDWNVIGMWLKCWGGFFEDFLFFWISVCNLMRGVGSDVIYIRKYEMWFFMIFFNFDLWSSGHSSWTWSKCLWWWDGDFIFFGNFLFFGFSYVISLGGRVWKKLIGKSSKWFFMIFLLLCGNHLGMLTKCCLWVCNVEMVFLQFLRNFLFFWIFVCNQLGG